MILRRLEFMQYTSCQFVTVLSTIALHHDNTYGLSQGSKVAQPCVHLISEAKNMNGSNSWQQYAILSKNSYCHLLLFSYALLKESFLRFHKCTDNISCNYKAPQNCSAILCIK